MFLRGIFLGALILVAAIGHYGVSVSAQASINTYGSCKYNELCANETPVSGGDASTTSDNSQQQSTVLTLSGLDVAVNLRDGQTLPRSGYTIVVTPLNGRGTTFQDATFFIDGVMRQQITPDVMGTARWLFRPDANQATAIVRIVVSGQDQDSVTKEFSVRIAAKAAFSGGPRAAVGRSDAGESTVVTYLRHAVAKVPAEVLRGFPYVLFLLLGVDVQY